MTKVYHSLVRRELWVRHATPNVAGHHQAQAARACRLAAPPGAAGEGSHQTLQLLRSNGGLLLQVQGHTCCTHRVGKLHSPGLPRQMPSGRRLSEHNAGIQRPPSNEAALARQPVPRPCRALEPSQPPRQLPSSVRTTTFGVACRTPSSVRKGKR